MAQHWMDVFRYADSNGLSRDDVRPGAHRYRTYEIDCFNADKPCDRFVKEQIAGDELKLAGQEALSLLWMGPYEMTAMTAAALAAWIASGENPLTARVMEVLNRPPTELSCERRDETTVVTQAFSLFHGDFVNGRARALAKAVGRDVGRRGGCASR